MDDKTSKTDFNQAVNPKKEVKINYSRDDLKSRLELQEKLAKNGRDMKFVEEMRKQIETKDYKDLNDRTKKDILYRQGKGVGLHLEGDRRDLERNREIQDQNFRNRLMENVKDYYKGNQSITRDFNKVVDKDAPKGKG